MPDIRPFQREMACSVEVFSVPYKPKILRHTASEISICGEISEVLFLSRGSVSMFESLSEKLETVFKKLRGEGKITEANVAENLREVRRVLLDADVNYKVAKQFIDDVQKRALGQEVLNSITPGQLIVKIIFDEMTKLLGESKAEIRTSQTPPTVVLIAGLQGSGKTTFSAKLARYLRSKGSNPLLVAADVHRPAAIDQLIALGKQIDIPVYSDRSASAVKIAEDALEFARRNIRDT